MRRNAKKIGSSDWPRHSRNLPASTIVDGAEGGRRKAEEPGFTCRPRGPGTHLLTASVSQNSQLTPTRTVNKEQRRIHTMVGIYARVVLLLLLQVAGAGGFYFRAMHTSTAATLRRNNNVVVCSQQHDDHLLSRTPCRRLGWKGRPSPATLMLMPVGETVPEDDMLEDLK